MKAAQYIGSKREAKRQRRRQRFRRACKKQNEPPEPSRYVFRSPLQLLEVAGVLKKKHGAFM
jgi:hypothetical protein